MPEQDTYYYDNDLSMLTKLRREIRSSRHRLTNELQDVTNSITLLKDNTNIISPVKNPSPLRESYIPSRSSSSHNKNYDIDSSLLDEDNRRYFSKDEYDKNSHLNDKKREKFLDIIRSPTLNKSQSQNASVRINRDKYKNLGFRPKGITDLEPEAKKYDFTSGPKTIASSVKRPQTIDIITPIKSMNLTDKRQDMLDSILQDKNYKNKNDDVSDLINKYKLTSKKQSPGIHKDVQDNDITLLSELEVLKSSMEEFPPHNERSTTFETEKQNDRLLRELRSYKPQVHATPVSPRKNKSLAELLSQNKTLCTQVEDLKQFVEFLEANFDKVYQKSQQYKLEKHQLHRRNQELLFINNYYKSLLSKYDRDEKPENTKHIDSTTENMLMFQPIKPGKTFRLLSSVKKFRALSYMVIATVRLRKRVRERSKRSKMSFY